MKIHFITYECGTKENRENFFKELYPLGKTCKNEPGCYQYEYFFPYEDDSKIFLLERWEDEAALELHMATENYKKIAQVKPKYNVTTSIIKYVGEEL